MPEVVATIGVIAGVVGLIGGIITIWVFFRPAMQRNAAVADAILGEAEVTDKGGGIITEARPGLVARTALLEEAVATLVDQSARLTALEAITQNLTVGQSEHAARLNNLELAAEERIAIRHENASLFRAVADKDALDGDL